MYKYETHLHSAPVSRCAQATVEESLLFYKNLGYDGVFLTNHFLGGNINVDKSKTYEQKLAFHFSDYEKALEIGKEIGIKVFFGTEMFYKGADFLVYGLDKPWFLAHPELMEMDIREKLSLMRESGALVIHAHPFREAGFIDHIRLYPHHVHGVEILNAGRTDFANEMARQYCENYGLIPFAGTDNHHAGAGERNRFAGMAIDAPLRDVADFKDAVLSGRAKPFIRDEAGFRLL